MKRIVTSESVNIGHPDKTCDCIVDAFLDEALRQDKDSQMAVECAIKNDKLFVYGEATTKASIDYDKIARDVLKDIGYKNDFQIVKEISEQSPDINQAVVKKNFVQMTKAWSMDMQQMKQLLLCLCQLLLHIN